MSLNVLPVTGRRAGYVISTRQMKMILEMPKAENHIHIEGSILPRTLFRLAERNRVNLPVKNESEFIRFVNDNITDLDSFMATNRMFNAVCVNEQDYEDVIYDLAVDAKNQNIIYQEYHLDYPLNQVRGIPLEVVMNGYRRGKERAKKELGLDIVFFAGIDRTLKPSTNYSFIEKVVDYLDIIDGIGMDCEEYGHPCREHVDCYRLAERMGLFCTAHTGEDYKVKDGDKEIWDAINILKVQRIDHGCQAIKDDALMDYLAKNNILVTVCPSANVGSNNATYSEHPVKEFYSRGIACSVNSDNPSISGDLVQQYARMLSLVGISEEALIEMARNAFVYSVKGQYLTPIFDQWHRKWQECN